MARARRPWRATLRRTRAACPPTWRRHSEPQWHAARLAGHRAGAVPPRESALGAARPAWRCGARWRLERLAARRGRSGSRRHPASGRQAVVVRSRSEVARHARGVEWPLRLRWPADGSRIPRNPRHRGEAGVTLARGSPTRRARASACHEPQFGPRSSQETALAWRGRATRSRFPRARPRHRHATRHPRLRHWGRVMRPPSPWADTRQPARQVHDPSPEWLVNSMSIRRDMRRTRYRAPCVREDWDIPGSRNMARGRQSETGAEAGGGLIDAGMVHQGSHPVRRNPHERGHRALRARARDRSSTALGEASVAPRGCRPRRWRR